MTVTTIPGVCPHDCPDTCALVTEVSDGRAVGLAASRDHPVTQGWLCAKVRPYLDHVYHPERLMYPMRRVRAKGSGRWARISWEEALADIGARWRTIIAEHGPAAILPYSYSGTLGLVQMTVASARLWNRLGASRLQRTICGVAAEFAVRATLGARWSPNYQDVRHSRLVIIWGHNPISTAPHFMPPLRQAQRAGCQVVVIDPYRSRTARGADWHLAPLPGTDGALALGLAHVIVRDGLQDESWLAAHAVGWPRLRERLADYPPARVAGLTGLPPADIERLATLYATIRPGLIKIADGLQRNHNGGQTVRAVCALPALTGQYGCRGGGLAYSSSDALRWDGAAVERWAECPPPARSVNMNRLGAALLGEVQDPPIMALYVFGANPATVNPNAGRVVAGLRRPDLFTVVHELFLTDTADYADIVLPATSQLEQTDLHKSYGHRVLAYNRPAIPPLGECKSNWEVMGLLAQEMGLSDPWLFESPETIIGEVLAATARNHPELAEITLERLERDGFVALGDRAEPPFAGGQFPTGSGKVELYSATLAAQGLDPLPDYADVHDDGRLEGRADFNPPDANPPLQLITAAGHYFVTSSLANQAGLRARAGQPTLEIHPEDAAQRGIETGDSVLVANARGDCRLVARVTDAVRPGVVASPKGTWSKHQPGGRNVNWTTSDVLADMAGQSTFHSNAVWVTRLSGSRPE